MLSFFAPALYYSFVILFFVFLSSDAMHLVAEYIMVILAKYWSSLRRAMNFLRNLYACFYHGDLSFLFISLLWLAL